MSNEKHQITGRIHAIMETQSFASGFSKREFVVDTGGDYPQQIKLELMKDKCAILDAYDIGDEVRVDFNLRGNEHNGRYYVNLAAWRIERTGEPQRREEPLPPATAPSMAMKHEDEDLEIPF